MYMNKINIQKINSKIGLKRLRMFVNNMHNTNVNTDK